MASAAARLTAAPKPMLRSSRIRRTSGKVSAMNSGLPSVDALSTTMISEPFGSDSRQRPRKSRLFQLTTSVEDGRRHRPRMLALRRSRVARPGGNLARSHDACHSGRNASKTRAGRDRRHGGRGSRADQPAGGSASGPGARAGRHAGVPRGVGRPAVAHGDARVRLKVREERGDIADGSARPVAGSIAQRRARRRRRSVAAPRRRRARGGRRHDLREDRRQSRCRS